VVIIIRVGEIIIKNPSKTITMKTMLVRERKESGR
jgi:hypothetical protein